MKCAWCASKEFKIEKDYGGDIALFKCVKCEHVMMNIKALMKDIILIREGERK
jgi:hypothetical protein